MVGVATEHPERRCVGCGRRAPQAELIRLAAVEDQVVLDVQRRLPGRGAYVCNHTCAEAALGRRALPRAFRRPISNDQDFLHSL
ncbi:YlxR family protein [Patulibacter medicamentivorans]|uniref:YlxR family protein n=1 Tax=Patulibacter medicamentivorans TaxID=1097667 RepID=UPI0009D97AAA